jgi:hypothetical protein
MSEQIPRRKEEETVEQLFGSVVAPERTGDHEPDSDILRSPLVEGESAHVFCGGCGTHTPVTQEGADELLKRAESSGVADWKKDYIHVQSCVWCRNVFAGLEILPIP